MFPAMFSFSLDVNMQLITQSSLKTIWNIIFLVMVPLVSSLSFNFTAFTPNDLNIIYESSAYPANNVIQLTRNQRDLTLSASVGRATYARPLHLWDKASRNLTDFDTNFSFTINSLNGSNYGDGIAFFLAPNGSRIPNNVTKGGSMALTPDFEPLNSTDNPFVAVEFDIYPNPNWDPPNVHVGIDINSMRSVANVTWWSTVSIREGREHQAWIRYDSQTKNLSVVFTGFRNRTYIIRQRLSYIVDLREYLPEFVTFGFSAATGSSSAIHSISSWSFGSSLEINRNETDNKGFQSRKKNKGMVIGLVIGGIIVLFFVLGLVGFCYMQRRKRKRKMNEGDEVFDISIGDDEFERGTGPKKFSYNELARATNNFSHEGKLGEGGFGGVYKGFLKEIDSYVAVKRVAKGSQQGIKEYASEVRIISRLRHRNLVQLLGWCHDKKELLLVYEFMPNKSLDSHLFKGKSLINWEIRFKIAHGLASSILYLHEEWEQCVVHRDIKSSNVMLDSNFNAKLGDFGLARLVDHEKGSQTTIVAGTMGYMAPECVITGKASKETDVFSFGVVALEIGTGRRPINQKARENEVNLVEWAWGIYGMGKILEAADPKLGDEYDAREMERLMVVGLWCAHPDSSLRPSIRQAILVLNFEAALPDLPLRMPVPMYWTPPAQRLSSTYHSDDSSGSYALSSGYRENTQSSNLNASSGALSDSSALLFTRS